MQPLFSNTASATGSGAPTLAASSSSPAMPSLPSIDPPKVSPTLSTVQGNETVKGQLGDLFDTANPLMVQARERASRSATGRGLQNSSLATQAGEQAFIGSALPIAQQDAQTYSQRAQQNNATENQFKLSEQQFGQQSALSRQQNAERLVELAAQGDVQAKLQLQKFGFDTSLSAQENIQKLQQQAAAGDIQAQLALAQFGYQQCLTTLQGEIAKDAQTLAHAAFHIALPTQREHLGRARLAADGIGGTLERTPPGARAVHIHHGVAHRFLVFRLHRDVANRLGLDRPPLAAA